MKMPVISLYPPWSNWVALGWKTIETRTHGRLASLAGRKIGIHSSLKWDRDALVLAAPFLDEAQLSESRMFLKLSGNIICTAYVREHRRLRATDSKAALIDCHSFTRYGLILEDVRPLPELICCRGKQGIWYYEIPGEV